MSPKNMTVAQFLFSPHGRIPRSTFWLRFYLPVMALAIVAAVLDVSLGTLDEESGFGLFAGLFTFLVIYPSIAVCIKRLHDRDRSGWFYLLLLVPLVNIWMGIELYFLRGTGGPNRYGPDPLQE